MAEDRVQLKQEEIVGNEVVLSDINPKSNTKSIDDPTTGASLDKTLERMWQSINNKLSRIVNSVNGRTGVVVLDSSDVGLGNVDNVSFADIKQWVITRTAQEFGFKRLELFNSLRDLDDTINHEWLHDEVYANKPFYSHHGYEANGVMDNRGYIGYIYYDSSDNKLKHTEMVLDTIGSADNSIIYNEHGHQNGETRDYSESGRIGVNIWTYEDALEVYNNISGDKTDSGLRINKDNIAPKLYFFDGVYGDGATSLDPNALLYYAEEDIRQDEPNAVDIYIDGTKIEYNRSNSLGQDLYNNTNYIKQSFKVNDLILCNFNDENYLQPVGSGHDNDRVIDNEMNPLLMLKRPCIGQVTKAPTAQDPSADYEIRFYSIRQNTYRGLKYDTVHTNASDYSNGALSVDLLATNVIHTKDQTQIYINQRGQKQIGLSGINAMYPYNSTNMHVTYGKSSKSKRVFRTILPSGLSDNIYRTDDTGLPNEQSSMYILPNYSLCVIPYIAFRNAVEPSHPSDNQYIPNWPATAPPLPIEPNYDFGDIDTNMLGINLVKGISTNQGHGHTYAVNLSGLRIDTDDFPIDNEWLGVDNNEHLPITTHSGGLSVNVGNFLEIGSSNGAYNVNKSPDDFYEEGKVNVRIDTKKGLYDVPSTTIPSGSTNSIGINLARESYIIGAYSTAVNWGNNYINGGLRFFIDQYEPTVGRLGVNTGMNGRGLSVQHDVPCDIRYDIGGSKTIICNNNVLGIQLYDMKTGNTEDDDSWTDVRKPGLELHYGITAEDISTILPIENIYTEKEWPSGQALIDYLDNIDPSSDMFDKDHVYAAGGTYYLVNMTGVTYEIAPCIVIYTAEDEYNRVIASLTPDDASYDPQWPETHQYHVFVYEEFVGDNEHRPLPSDDRLNKYGIICKRYYDLDSTPNVIPLYLPDINNDGLVTSNDSSDALIIIDICNFNNPIWLTDEGQGNVRYFTDASCTNELVLTDSLIDTYLLSQNYASLYSKDYNMIYQVKKIDNQLTLVKYTPSFPVYRDWSDWDWDNNAANTENYYQEMMHRIDTNQNGRFILQDARFILAFVADLNNPQKYKGWKETDAWIDFMRLKGYTVITGDTVGVDTLFECKYEKGLRVKYDEYRGVTYNPNYSGGTLIDKESRSASAHQANFTTDDLIGNATKNALSIKIADPSAGVLKFNETTCGGLRFTSDGYLGVRVNMRNNYNAAIPGRRTGSDDMTVGTHGLHIYDQNILGVQLTEDGDLDNGELCFDRNGNLRISATFNPGKENLTISGKLNGTTTNIPYNGSEPVTITLGPGLCFSEDT